MKWFGKGRKQSGEFQLLPPAQPVQLNHYIDVEGRDNASLIAEQLHGFSTSVGLSPFDHGIGPTHYQVVASHAHIPEAAAKEKITPETALARAQKAIRQAIGQVPSARYAGWDRTPMPAEPSRRHHHDDDGDDDSGPPLPLRS